MESITCRTMCWHLRKTNDYNYPTGLPLNFQKKIQGYSRSFFENIAVFQGSFEKIQGSKETGIQG